MRYRGVREWARQHAPGLLLGVLGEDELEDLRSDFNARRAVPVESIPSAPALEHQPVMPVMATTSVKDIPESKVELQPATVHMEPQPAVRVVQPEGANLNVPTSKMIEASLAEDLAAAQTREDVRDVFDAWVANHGERAPHAARVYAMQLCEARAAELPNPPQPPLSGMTPEQIEARIAEWIPAMRKCKTVDELQTYNNDMIAPLVETMGEAIPKESLAEAERVFKGRLSILKKTVPR
jgi:hypothetical protein